MKINFKKFLKNKIFLHKHYEPHTIGEKAHDDWRVLLIISFILVVLTLLFSIYTFRKVTNKNFLFSTEGKDKENITLDEEKLNEILETLNNRQNNLENIFNNNHVVRDPSF